MVSLRPSLYIQCLPSGSWHTDERACSQQERNTICISSVTKDLPDGTILCMSIDFVIAKNYISRPVFIRTPSLVVSPDTSNYLRLNRR